MQKIRMLFALLITLPLILGYSTHNNFNNVMEDALEKADVFDSKSNQEKDKILKELVSSIRFKRTNKKIYLRKKFEPR